MIDAVIIKSSRSVGKLTFSEPKPPDAKRPVDRFRVSVEDHHLAASSAKIYIYQPDSLAAFFEDLAASREGWEGVKQWHSIEKDLALSCTLDKLDFVAIDVTLKSSVYQDEWCVNSIIYLEGHQLQNLATRIKRFLHL